MAVRRPRKIGFTKMRMPGMRGARRGGGRKRSY
jgi:hypothetical protein